MTFMLHRPLGACLVLGILLTAAFSGCSGEDPLVTSAGSGGSGKDAAAGTAGAGRGGTAGSAGAGGVSGSGGTGGSGGASGGSAGSAGTVADSGSDRDASADVATDTGSDAVSDSPDDVADSGGCGPNRKRCGADCVRTDDPAHGCAGASCTPCSNDGASEKCVGGACTITSCAAGRADCNGLAADGCEVTLASDAAHCGACGSACRLAHATASCNAGVCAIATCANGFENCDGDPKNGCEVFVAKDPTHCGSCPKVCTPTPGAAATCNGGTCGEKACAPGLMDCDNNTNNGCETNLASDPNNCGFCGNSCSLPNATATCVGGVCRVGSCTGGFLNCDGVPSNGCETDPRTSALNCGACGRACQKTGTSSVRCEAGTCRAVCDSRGDCRHPAAPAADDACETAILGDVRNCGACGNVCTTPSGTPACNAGKCAIGNCPGSLGDCDGEIANGCETDLSTSTDHCGACDRACATTSVASRACSGGVCNSSCSAGFGNCVQPAAPAADDGCETATGADVANCGACGRACSGANVASRACESGRCTSTCKLGFGNCAEPPAPLADDGCETDVDGAAQRCGSCRNDCSLQGGGGSGLRCGAPEPNLCGCAGNDARCRLSGASGTCNAANGQCVCGGVECGPGEACQHVGQADRCSCNDGSACAAGQACCQTPAGCRDLASDPASCGACGRACPPGFVCASGECQCSGDASCNAGAAGTCTAATGLCHCGATTCAVGQRCLAGGSCG